MQPSSRSLFLLRQSATVFRRAHDLPSRRPAAEGNLFDDSFDLSAPWPGGAPDGDEDDDEKPCYICMSSLPNGVLMECGHGGLCYACGLELARKGHHCPLCREVINEVVQNERVCLRTERRNQGSLLAANAPPSSVMARLL